MKKFITVSLIFLIMFTFLYFNSFIFYSEKEGYKNYLRLQNLGEYHTSDLLLENDYATNEYNGVSNKSASNIWKTKPVVEVGSYLQTNNNLKNVSNPDMDGNCSPADFCDVLYVNKSNQNNTYYPLPPVEETPHHIRVGYFNAAA